MGARKDSVSWGIGRYLASLEAGTSSGYIRLGPGQVATDPDEVDAMADKVEGKLSTTTGTIARLRLRQRVLDLRAAAEELRSGPETGLDYFIEHAADWARAEGISYTAFRDAGVPPAVLKRAGIKRTS